MNKKEFVKKVSDTLKESNIKKPVSIPKQVFHISDDDGNSKDFTIKKTEKEVIFTLRDVSEILDACFYVIQESLKKGEHVCFQSFGTFAPHYRKPRKTKLTGLLGTNDEIEIPGRYIARFWPGSDMKEAAKIYDITMREQGGEAPAVEDDEESELS